MSIPDIVTARLRLVAITPELLDAESVDAKQLEPLLRVRVPAEWPDENWEPHVFDFIRAQFVERPETLGWHRHIVLPGKEPVLIGSAGAFPRGDHEAEFGYAVLKPWQRQGFATEAARAVIAAVFALPHITSVVGHTFPHMVESMRVMEKCGLVLDGGGDEEGTVRYRLQRVTA